MITRALLDATKVVLDERFRSRL